MKKQTLTEGLRRTREIMGLIMEGNEYNDLVAQVREVGLRFADLRTLKDEVEQSTTLSKEDKTKLLKMIDGKISETGLNEHGGGVDMELYKNLKLAKQGEFFEESSSSKEIPIKQYDIYDTLSKLLKVGKKYDGVVEGKCIKIMLSDTYSMCILSNSYGKKDVKVWIEGDSRGFKMNVQGGGFSSTYTFSRS